MPCALAPIRWISWLATLNDLQRPAMIDFSAWAEQAKAAPQLEGRPALPSPPAALRAVLEHARARPLKHPERWLSPPGPVEPLSVEALAALLDGRTSPLPSELIGLFQLAAAVRLDLDPYTLEIPPLNRGAYPGILLKQWFGSPPPLRYQYVVQPDGTVAQVTWYDRGAECDLETPLRVAGSIAEFLQLVLSHERTTGNPPRWSPGPVLPRPGEPPGPGPTREQVAANRRRLHEAEQRARGLPSLETPDAEPPTAARAYARIEAWLGKHAPNFCDALAGPASPADLKVLASLAGGSLPAAVREAYARHDGQAFEAPSLVSLFAGYELLPIQMARSEYESMCAAPPDCSLEAEGPVRGHYWSRGWFPVTLLGGASNYHCLDFDPAPGGTVGQVIEVFHDGGERRVIAGDLGEYLARFARALERGWATVADDAIVLDDSFAFPPAHTLLGGK
jgi:cell wall assembly regulator SMI1